MAKNDLDKFKIVLIGGSAGSIDVLLQILPQLKKNTKLAIVIIIHRKSSFESTLTKLFQSKTTLLVKEAEEKELILPGTIYLAPADYHLLIEDDQSFSLDFSEKILHSRPAIDATFQTAADVYKKEAIAILLSGANADGVAGLNSIQKRQGYVVVQDPEDAEISYMPAQALLSLTPDQILTKYQIGDFINNLNQ